jgi:hypothetical protein
MVFVRYHPSQLDVDPPSDVGCIFREMLKAKIFLGDDPDTIRTIPFSKEAREHFIQICVRNAWKILQNKAFIIRSYRHKLIIIILL